MRNSCFLFFSLVQPAAADEKNSASKQVRHKVSTENGITVNVLILPSAAADWGKQNQAYKLILGQDKVLFLTLIGN